MWNIVTFSCTSHWLTYARCEVALCSTVHNSVQMARADILCIPWFFYIIQCQKVIVLILTFLSSSWYMEIGSKLICCKHFITNFKERHPRCVVDKLYPTWWWPQQQWPKHVVDKLYTLDNIAVLWLLNPYRIITLCFITKCVQICMHYVYVSHPISLTTK